MTIFGGLSITNCQGISAVSYTLKVQDINSLWAESEKCSCESCRDM